MRYRVTVAVDQVRIELFEKLGFKDHHEFRKLIAEASAAKRRRVTVDLSGLAAVDSAGLGLLVLLNDKVKQDGGSVSLTRPNQTVARLLAIVEFNKLFEIEA
ncbi:MAG TPA: STAS domain-containing protein [Aliidongia sp.]|nr:STAS domain-containing protein [Aliidongia sp.]